MFYYALYVPAHLYIYKFTITSCNVTFPVLIADFFTARMTDERLEAGESS